MKSKLGLYLMCSLVFAISNANASGDTTTYGPLAFSSGSVIEFPLFALSNKYLHAVVFTITNCTSKHDLTVQRFSTNTTSFNVGSYDRVVLSQWSRTELYTGRSIAGADYHLGSLPADLTGIFSDADEVTNCYTLSDLFFQTTVTESSKLGTLVPRLTSETHIFVSVEDNVMSAGTTNIHWTLTAGLTGILTVVYQYEDYPLQPTIDTFAATDTTVVLQIHDLSIGSSNTIQRADSLVNPAWTNTCAFVATNDTERGIGMLQTNAASAFFRVKSE